MAERVPIRCLCCGRVYTARKADDELTIPTDDGACECGTDEFETITVTTSRRDERAS